MTEKKGVRDRLLDAAAEILEHEGLKSLNTNALAAAAGVTPPTVYRHFENKEAVVIALADRFTVAETVWLESALMLADRDQSIDDLLDALIDAYWSAARREKGIVALRGAMRVWPELREVEDASLTNSTNLLTEVLRPRLRELKPDAIRRLSRQIVEIVCATIDRCYPLPPKEQGWRISELKSVVKAYAASKS